MLFFGSVIIFHKTVEEHYCCVLLLIGMHLLKAGVYILAILVLVLFGVWGRK
jgi:hypothetical protein